MDHEGSGNIVHCDNGQSTTGWYALATGAAVDYRLRILHALYGPGTRRAVAVCC